MEAQIVKNGSHEASWRGLGRSWSHLGSKMAPRAKKASKSDFWGTLLGAKLEAKIVKNRSQEPSTRWWFFDHSLDRLLERFCANLAPTCFPKPSQNGGKLVPKSMQVGLLIWELFWKGSRHHFCWIFASTWHGRCSKNHLKHIVFYDFCYFGCWAVGLTYWLIFYWFWLDLGIENQSEIFQKSIQKVIKNNMRFWMDLGGLWERFWMDFFPKFGGKLGPSWHQNLKNDGTKTMSKKHVGKMSRW